MFSRLAAIAMHEDVVEGQLLAGKYRIARVLGRGGMGVVVAAHHVVLDQLVAIKFMLPEALGSADAVARFEREARAAVRIQSEHVARVTDVGRLDNGAPYMVMELLRGRDLEVLLRERGPLPLADVADYVLQAGEAIAEAHGLGIVHRDLKPANLFLTQRADGSACIKVLDFGISKLINSSSSGNHGLTSTTAVMGSPLYMSPEQLMSARNVDLRTDIWALGVICFELLSGKLPFQADTLPQLCMAISMTSPTPLRSYRPDLPPEVEAIVLRCLRKDPGERYATVAELAAELVKYAPARARISAERIERLARSAGLSGNADSLPPSLGGTVTSAWPSVGGTMASAAPREVAHTVGDFARTKRAPSSGKVRWGLSVGALLAMGGVGALFLRRPATDVGDHGNESSSSQPPSAAQPPPSVMAPPPFTSAPVADTTPPQALPSAAVLQSAAAVTKQPSSPPVTARPATSNPSAQSLAAKAVDRKEATRKGADSRTPGIPSGPLVQNTKPAAAAAAAPSASEHVAAPTPTPSPRSRL